MMFLFTCVSKQLENVITMMLFQIGFKHPVNQGILFWTHHHSQAIWVEPLEEEGKQ